MSSPDQKIRAIFMLEVMGRPPEHLKETLKEFIGKINGEKGVEVKTSEIHEPKELEDEKGFYTTFADIEVETDSLKEIMAITFRYMPSHIEVISPENLKVDNNYFNEIFNEITRRLHAYDQVARIVQNEKMVMEKQLKELAEKKKEENKSSE